MLLALVAASASLVTAAFTLLVSGYFSARNEQDKKMIEMRYRQLDEVVEGLSKGQTSSEIDSRVFLHFPKSFDSWQRFWVERNRCASSLGDAAARQLLKDLHAEAASSNEGMLLGTYSSARDTVKFLGTILGILLAVQLLRVGFLANPEMDSPLEPLVFYLSPEPFNYELFLSRQLQAMQDVRL